MDMKAFLSSLGDDDAREAFAARCETTAGHLRNIAYQTRPCSTEIAVAVERESQGAVTRQELCPGNWRKRWPELVAAAPHAKRPARSA